MIFAVVILGEVVLICVGGRGFGFEEVNGNLAKSEAAKTVCYTIHVGHYIFWGLPIEMTRYDCRPTIELVMCGLSCGFLLRDLAREWLRFSGFTRLTST